MYLLHLRELFIKLLFSKIKASVKLLPHQISQYYDLRKNFVVFTSSSFLRQILVVPIWTMLIRERLSSIYRQLTSWTSKYLKYRLLSKITKLPPIYVVVPISTVRWFVQSKSGKISSIMLQKLYLEINQKPAN